MGIVAVLLIVAVLSVMGATITVFVATGAVSKTNELVREQAFYLAQAGFEYALMRKAQGVSPDGNHTLGNGTFQVTYAPSGLITVSPNVNAMMGASSPSFTIKGPAGSSMAGCLTVNIAGANLQGGNTQLMGITLQNTCAIPITIATMQTDWTPEINEKLTQIFIGGAGQVYNNPAGSPSGTVADIADTTIAAGTTVPLSQLVFAGSMAGKNFVIHFNMTDSSSKSAVVQFVCGTQANALYADVSGAYVGGASLTYLYGVMLYNACAAPATIQINKMTLTYAPANRKTKQIIIGPDTVYSSGGASSGTQLTLNPTPQITSGLANGKAQTILTNGDMRGYNVSIVYLMNDNSTKTVAIDLYEQAPEACLQVINAGCSIGGAGNAEIRGQQWKNTCSKIIIVDRLTAAFTGGTRIKAVDVNGVNRWSGNGSNTGSNLNLSPLVEMGGNVTLTVDRYWFNNSMAGLRITSDAFRFYPSSNTYTYNATTCP